ncbi:MAG: hypothetical protein FJW40_04905 [Acidobacteria bacterium]|nr:hypothetical protein [Acidobacteriota bacterium]
MCPRWILGLYFCCLATLTAQTISRQNLKAYLGFENATVGEAPPAWAVSPVGGAVADDKVFRSGKLSARMERTGSSPGEGSFISLSVPLDFAARQIEWRGWLKTEGVTRAAAIWMRLDGETPSLAFVSTEGAAFRFNNDWREFRISLPRQFEAKRVTLGVFLLGTGKMWADDLSLWADGKPVEEAPAYQPNALDLDTEFDTGSRVGISGLTEVQTANVVRLAKIWGFLKYHHPAITGGQKHWDYELFRILPRVLEAADGAAVNQVLLAWINGLGEVPECSTCATLDAGRLHLGPNLAWTEDEAQLGPELSQLLRAIYRNRSAAAGNFYVSFVPGVGNPVFEHERSYRVVPGSDAGYQLLTLFRMWNMVEYFFPYRDVMSDDPAESAVYWDKVLMESIPGFALAAGQPELRRELLRFIAKMKDTHANLWNSLDSLPPSGGCQVSAGVRFAEGKAVVAWHNTRNGQADGSLRVGDVLLKVGETPVEELVRQWTPFYAASNDAARLRDIAANLTRGECGPVSLAIQRGTEELEVTAERVGIGSLAIRTTRDRPGNAYQTLANDVAYLKLSGATAQGAAAYFGAASRSRGLIIDIRNYPLQFVVFALGNLLAPRNAEFARFTAGDPANPGAFSWGPVVSLQASGRGYPAKIAILVDDTTQSQGEYTAMAFRTVPGAVVIGSTTAGADGNTSPVPLPWGLRSAMSGVGVFYPDKKPTQRVGILPDIVVTPTIAGIAAGRDEVLEEALRLIGSANTQRMTLFKSGTGSLEVQPGGLFCDAACLTAVQYVPVGQVTVTSLSGTLGSWGGDCSGTAGSRTLTVTPEKQPNVYARFSATPPMTSLIVVPHVAIGGMQQQLGRIQLEHAAPAGGMSLRLRSSRPEATVPERVEIAAGQDSVSFPVTTRTVAAPVEVKITASGGGKELEISPWVIPRTNNAPFAMEFAPVPAGEYPRTAFGVTYSVRLSRPFEMGRFEVTQAQWRSVMGYNNSRRQGDNLPVETVAWWEVQEFLARLNNREDGYRYRLPTTAEWEFAARGGRTIEYTPDELRAAAWFRENSGGTSHPVGTKSANGYRLHDMLGNVGEYVQAEDSSGGGGRSFGRLDNQHHPDDWQRPVVQPGVSRPRHLRHERYAGASGSYLRREPAKEPANHQSMVRQFLFCDARGQ